MNARTRAIEAELIFFFSKIVGVEVVHKSDNPTFCALRDWFPTDEEQCARFPHRSIREVDVEDVSLTALAERIAQL